jgi:hypothetical protein
VTGRQGTRVQRLMLDTFIDQIKARIVITILYGGYSWIIQGRYEQVCNSTRLWPRPSGAGIGGKGWGICLTI